MIDGADEAGIEIAVAHPRDCNCSDCKLERQLKASIKTPRPAKPIAAPRELPAISPPPPSQYVDLGAFVDIKPFDDAVAEIFAERKLERSGGASGAGWSSRVQDQACPYKFYLLHRAPKKSLPVLAAHKPAREVGAMWHQLLAFRYLRLLGKADQTIPTEEFRDELLHRKVSAEVVMEAMRLFTYYESRYENDYLRPIAVEVKHGWRQHTCRYDLVAEVEADNPEGLFPGVYNVEHKTTARFDAGATDGWKNDGEILGQEMIWKGAGLNRKYGRLQGTIVNIMSKVKLPEMRRIIIPTRPKLVKAHARDLDLQDAEMALRDTYGVWPKRRAACVGRYGLCDFFSHCGEE